MMYCQNCGTALAEGAAFCAVCGAPAGAGCQFCPDCGRPTPPGIAACTYCGRALPNSAAYQQAPPPPPPPYGGYPGDYRKSRIAAGLLGIFLGYLGIHNFYLGYTSRGVTQLLLGTVGGFLTCGVATAAAGIWGLVEGIMIFAGSINVDAGGYPLKD